MKTIENVLLIQQHKFSRLDCFECNEFNNKKGIWFRYSGLANKLLVLRGRHTRR